MTRSVWIKQDFETTRKREEGKPKYAVADAKRGILEEFTLARLLQSFG